MASQPFNEDHLPEIIDGHHKPEGVALDVENDTIIAHDASLETARQGVRRS